MSRHEDGGFPAPAEPPRSIILEVFHLPSRTIGSESVPSNQDLNIQLLWILHKLMKTLDEEVQRFSTVVKAKKTKKPDITFWSFLSSFSLFVG